MLNTTPIDPDAVLIPRLLAGDKAAFESLVREYHLPLKRVAAAIVGEGQAEEVVQEAWISVLRNLSTFESRSSLKTWLYTIVANEAKGRLRKGKREVSMENSDEVIPCDESRFAPNGHWRQPHPAWHDNSPEALLSHEEFRKCLDKTLHLLPTDQKAVLTLREYQGLELEEICNILGLSASNIRVLIHRARLRVHAMVERYEETGKC
jgi:RNA polymerase sigma-70 factor (ECF subfamily)